MPENLPPTDDTRQRILQAAAEIFAEKGFTRATTKTIADAAGVNEVTLFRHFGNKRNLLSEMIQQNSALPDLSAFIENQLTGDYRQDLIRFGTVFFNAITQRKEALRLMLCEAKELPEVREVVVQVPDQLRLMIANYFEEKMDQGLVREINPELMAQGFLGMFFSYGIAREMLGSQIAPGVPQEALIAQFVDIFVNGTLQDPKGFEDL
jgi:AcrR family transcriptional regulator